MLNKVIAEDPSYALGYVELADAHYHASGLYLRPAESLIQVKAAAKKALELDENLAEAHALLAVVSAISVTYLFARQPPMALKHAREAQANSESFWFGYWSAALAHEQSGQLVEAWTNLKRHGSATPRHGSLQCVLACMQNWAEENLQKLSWMKQPEMPVRVSDQANR